MLKTVAGKVGSIFLGILVLAGISMVKGWFRHGSDPVLSDRPIPAASMTLDFEGRPVTFSKWECWLSHDDDDLVRLSFEGPGLSVEDALDFNGDGKRNSKDHFEKDIDDPSSCDILKGRMFSFRGDKEHFLELEGAGKCRVLRWSVTPGDYWRPKLGNGTDAWSGDIEVTVKVGEAEKTLRGRFEGPVTHVW